MSFLYGIPNLPNDFRMMSQLDLQIQKRTGRGLSISFVSHIDSFLQLDRAHWNRDVVL